MGEALVEGMARVVAVDGALAWLEPEQSSSCGGCRSASLCGALAGKAEGRLVARRFALANDQDLTVGERVVVGISEGTVRRASGIVYGVPLLAMLIAGITAQKLVGGDGAAALATVAGLVIGLGVVHLRGRFLSARGDLTPRFIRRARGSEAECHGTEE